MFLNPPFVATSLHLPSSRFPATYNYWTAAATCLAMYPTFLLHSVPPAISLPAVPRPTCPCNTVRPTMSDGTLPARTKHEDWCGNELVDRTSARRLWRHNSAAHLPLSPHLVLKVPIGSLEIIHLGEQQLA